MTDQWTAEYDDGGKFDKFFRGLPSYEQAVVSAAIEKVLEVYGQDICSGSWGKPLGGGLYEFRIGTTLDSLMLGDSDYVEAAGNDKKVLIRIFCAFYGEKVALLHHGYNKGKDPSAKRQQREIKAARKIHKRWAANK